MSNMEGIISNALNSIESTKDTTDLGREKIAILQDDIIKLKADRDDLTNKNDVLEERIKY